MLKASACTPFSTCLQVTGAAIGNLGPRRVGVPEQLKDPVAGWVRSRTRCASSVHRSPGASRGAATVSQLCWRPRGRHARSFHFRVKQGARQRLLLVNTCRPFGGLRHGPACERCHSRPVANPLGKGIAAGTERRNGPSAASRWHRDPRFTPYAFTGHGSNMAATTLNSHRGIEMSIYVVRAFVKLRDLLSSNRELARRFAQLGDAGWIKLTGHDETIAAILSAIRQLMGKSSTH
ncbi:MAG: hypothetical protein JWO52_5707 [Gammaproteobacteria bacterium]|nr:hypothetical protein [Gammaproteobacteria bacterium]